ncbi:MAG TPA: dienelactone hydrolase family protein [Kofleriaceae bacterium]|jgi:carboxymethylenebutenolidase
MKLTTSTVELPGQMAGYFAHPGVKEPVPGVIVIQEIWGVDAHMRDVADRFAAAGYAAIAPDLFSRGGGRPPELSEPRMEATKSFLDALPPNSWGNLMDPSKRDGELARLAEPERSSVGGTVARLFNPERFASLPSYVQNLVEIAAWLRARPEVGGRKVGAVGYCMGGGLAGALAAADPALSASVIYYGQPPAADQVGTIGCPVLVLVGAEDARLVAPVEAFAQAMQAAGKPIESHVYPATPHAFFNDTRGSYRVTAARDSWARTLALFARALA